MTLGQRIAAERAAKDLGQVALAEAAGISQPTLANIERGRNDPSWDTLTRIAKALGLPAWKLVRPL